MDGDGSGQDFMRAIMLMVCVYVVVLGLIGLVLGWWP